VSILNRLISETPTRTQNPQETESFGNGDSPWKCHWGSKEFCETLLLLHRQKSKCLHLYYGRSLDCQEEDYGSPSWVAVHPIMASSLFDIFYPEGSLNRNRNASHLLEAKLGNRFLLIQKRYRHLTPFPMEVPSGGTRPTSSRRIASWDNLVDLYLPGAPLSQLYDV